MRKKRHKTKDKAKRNNQQMLDRAIFVKAITEIIKNICEIVKNWHK